MPDNSFFARLLGEDKRISTRRGVDAHRALGGGSIGFTACLCYGLHRSHRCEGVFLSASFRFGSGMRGGAFLATIRAAVVPRNELGRSVKKKPHAAIRKAPAPWRAETKTVKMAGLTRLATEGH